LKKIHVANVTKGQPEPHKRTKADRGTAFYHNRQPVRNKNLGLKMKAINQIQPMFMKSLLKLPDFLPAAL
jgi:hypothetical protein